MADFVYDPDTGEYRDAETNKTVPEQTIRDAVEVAITALVLVLMGLTEDLKDGAITLAEWHAVVSAQITAGHVALGSIGTGGLANLTPEVTTLLDTAVAAQLGFLDAWAADLAAAAEPMTEAALIRAGMYGHATWGTYSAGLGLAATRKGMAEESNVIESAQPCDGCRAATAAGWVRIGFLPPVGSRSCLSNCRCVIRYRTADEAQAARETERLAAVA